MKIIHTADLHFDSKMETNLSNEKASERNFELRLTFQRLVEYASENQVKVILICGDLFDSVNVKKSTRSFFMELIEKYGEIDFLVLKGNHDEYNLQDEECPCNLKFFNDQFTYFQYGNVCISGLNLDKRYLPNVFDLLKFNENNFNILCLHGQIANTYMDSVEYCVPLNALTNKNINYVALGHIHDFYFEKYGDFVYGYCGALEPRGFDECGEKGFIEIEINETVQYKFVPFSKRQFHAIKVDITNADTVRNAVNESVKKFSGGDLIKCELVGEYDLQTEKDIAFIEKELNEKFYFAKVVDNSQMKIDLQKLQYDVSLKGEFLRTVLDEQTLSQVEKDKIIALGIKALTRGEL